MQVFDCLTDGGVVDGKVGSRSFGRLGRTRGRDHPWRLGDVGTGDGNFPEAVGRAMACQ